MGQFRVVAVLIGCALLATCITYILYNYTQVLLKERLQERLVAIVSTAATQIDPSDVETVTGIENLHTPAMERLVSILQEVRSANNDITYAYMMRRTSDPNILEFVADADSLLPLEEVDLNADGILDVDEQIPLPGDPFDASPYPTLRDEAFYHAVAANDLEEDKWSIQLSAYAPIFSDAGESLAVIGIDVVVDDFRERTQAMLLPFALFIFFLILLLMLLTSVLVRFYNERVEIFKEIDRQKDELLSIVSHQLAQPVTSLRWYIEMMLGGDIGKPSSEQEVHLKTMESVTVGLVDLVQMILDVSRIQLGRMKVDRTDIDLKEFFKEIVSIVELKAIEKGINLKVTIPETVTTGFLDKRLMHMTLENLLSNAVKYTDKGGSVSLDVKINKNVLIYEVKDTGCGIPISDQGKIFGKLYRASNVRKIDGNGFGLYIAKGAVESQGGSISFTSSEGEGTKFIVSIPLGQKPKA